MPDHKYVINELSAFAKKAFDNQSVIVDTVADNENVYDNRLTFRPSQSMPSTPHQMSLSYDKDTGYYIDIDGVTLEYDKNENLFKSDATKYLTAIRDNKVRVVTKAFLGIFKQVKVVITDSPQEP